MSDQENDVNRAQAQQSQSSSEQMIPKQRFDEILNERNRLREERELQNKTVHSLTNLIQQSRQPQRARPVEEDPMIKKLRENGNQELADLVSRQQSELRQLRNGFKTMADDQDRNAFIGAYGKQGQAALQQVEEIVEAERQRGNFAVTRQGVFLWLKGQERLMAEQNAENAPVAKAPVAQQAAPSYSSEDAPDQNPNSITHLPQGGASVGQGGKTREQRIKELEDVEF